MLDHECIDPIKKQKLNQDCGDFQLRIPSGLVNISCDDKLLFDTLLCNKMISEGACECIYGRKQIQGICNVSPLNISCPQELKSKDVAIINKIKELQEESKECKAVGYQRKERGFQYLINNFGPGGFIFMVLSIVIGVSYFIYNKKK